MKGQPIQLFKGSTLKTQIYNSISKNKLAHTTKLLRNTLTTHFKYPSSKSQKIQMKTEVFSPAPKTEASIHKMSRSVNQTYTNHKMHQHNKSQNNKSKDHLLRVEGRRGKGEKNKSKSQIILKNRSPKNKSHSDSCKKLDLNLTEKKGQKEKKEKKERKEREKCCSSMERSCRKINLESIIEQSSSEQQLITPDNKNKKQREKSGSSLSQSRTKKKEQYEVMNDSLKRKIERSFKQPQIFQKILKTSTLTISYRILKKRLIEIEIYTLKNIDYLKVELDKGNLQCQTVNEEYKHVSANTVLALFSSVRNIDVDSVKMFPRIEVEFVEGEEREERSVVVPYSWLHFTDERVPSLNPSLKKSKIKTKLCLSDIPITSTHLTILSSIFHTWIKKTFKGHQQFQTSFNLCDQQYGLKLIQEANERFTLQLEGKGQTRLTNMIQFIQKLIS